MRFINSRATPSAFSSSVTVMSSATVSFPSEATSHPGMSSEEPAGETVVETDVDDEPLRIAVTRI